MANLRRTDNSGCGRIQPSTTQRSHQANVPTKMESVPRINEVWNGFKRLLPELAFSLTILGADPLYSAMLAFHTRQTRRAHPPLSSRRYWWPLPAGFTRARAIIGSMANEGPLCDLIGRLVGVGFFSSSHRSLPTWYRSHLRRFPALLSIRTIHSFITQSSGSLAD